MEYKDYYAVLGVKKDATEKEIRQAFRRLARQYHPDVNPNNKEAEEHFKEINEAYEVLSDPEKRKRYDEMGADWERYQQYQQARPQRAGAAPGRSACERKTLTISLANRARTRASSSRSSAGPGRVEVPAHLAHSAGWMWKQRWR